MEFADKSEDFGAGVRVQIAGGFIGEEDGRIN